MITKNRQLAAFGRAYTVLLICFTAGLFLPFGAYRSEIMDDRLFFAVSCIFIFCASLCCMSGQTEIFQPLLCTLYSLIIGKNVYGSPQRFIFCCISYPLYFYISANAFLSALKKRKGGQGFIIAVGIISLAAAMFLLCIK